METENIEISPLIVKVCGWQADYARTEAKRLGLAAVDILKMGVVAYKENRGK